MTTYEDLRLAKLGFKFTLGPLFGTITAEPIQALVTTAERVLPHKACSRVVVTLYYFGIMLGDVVIEWPLKEGAPITSWLCESDSTVSQEGPVWLSRRTLEIFADMLQSDLVIDGEGVSGGREVWIPFIDCSLNIEVRVLDSWANGEAMPEGALLLRGPGDLYLIFACSEESETYFYVVDGKGVDPEIIFTGLKDLREGLGWPDKMDRLFDVDSVKGWSRPDEETEWGQVF